jgi:hypothetical protein
MPIYKERIARGGYFEGDGVYGIDKTSDSTPFEG